MAELGPGTKLPSWTLPFLAGEPAEIPGAHPLALVTVFKASCPTCRWALPFVQALHEKAGAGLAVIGVAQDEEETARELAGALGLTFPIAIEEEPWSASASFGLTTVPTLFLVDEASTILLTSVGFARDDLHEIARRAAVAAGSEAVDPFPAQAEIPAFRPG